LRGDHASDRLAGIQRSTLGHRVVELRQHPIDHQPSYTNLIIQYTYSA
jgi:hypothetical protein